MRGSRFNTGKADSMRCGYRESKFNKRGADIIIGFRCEWCISRWV